MNPAPTPLTPRQEWSLLLMLAGIQFTHIADFMVMMPLGPQFMQLFHLTPQQFGLLVSSYTFSAALAGLLAALVVDRFDRKRLVLWLYGAFTLVTFLCALAPNYATLLVARSLAGAFGGVLGAMVLTLVGDVIPEQRRGVAMGTIMAAFSASTIFGVPMGLYLSSVFHSWGAPFIFLGCLGVIIWVASYFLLPSVTQHLQRRLDLRQTLNQIVTVLKYRNHQKAFLLITLMMLGGFTVIPFISMYLALNVGIRFADLTWIYLAGGAATLFSSRFIGRMADRYGKPRTYRVVATLSLIPLFVITHLVPVALGWAILVMVAFFIFVSGRIIPGLAVVTSGAIPRYRGTFMSLNSSVQQCASGIASLLGGMIVSRSASGALMHYDYVGYVAIGATLLAMWLVGKIDVER